MLIFTTSQKNECIFLIIRHHRMNHLNVIVYGNSQNGEDWFKEVVSQSISVFKFNE